MKEFETQMAKAAERHEAAMTLPQEQRAWAQLNTQYPPQSETEYQFPNGWSVQRHDTINDIRRVGEMTRNCWQGIGLGSHNIERWDPAQKLKGLSPSYQDDYHALHDEHGIPRAVWNTNGQNSMAEAVTGARNGPVKAEHWPMIQQWATATGRTVDPNEDPYYDQYT